MNVRKFIAANAREALKKVKETLGNDAIILSNRSIPGGVEIMAVASRDMAMIVPAGSDRPAAERPAAPEGEDYRVSLSSAPRQTPVRAPAPAAEAVPVREAALAMPLVNAGIPRTGALRQFETPRPAMAPVPEAPRAPEPRREAEVVPAEVMDEIRSLRRIVEQHLAGFTWNEASRSAPAKTEALRQLLDAGFSPQFARDVLTGLPADFDAAQAMAWVKGAADRSLITVGSEDDIVDRGGVYALVGPTGVGKTTTTAKLAARCVMRHGPNKVALVTTDGYRIGAHEQLRIYGRILGVSVHLVKDANELAQTLAELAHKHMVLIDTMGMSQKDRLVPELTGMLAGCRVQRLLLLSSTSRGDTLDDVVRAYQGDGLAGCILTKVDEAASLATALDVIMRHRLRLLYVSNGQRVPEDIHLPNRTYLLHRAFKDLPAESPHRLAGSEPAMLMASAGLSAAGGARG
ncbi:MAG: flagellar biosynthesis protein FlhF [Azonexus sp.]|nr:flagellar biosynthesis protein FlhF [Betaproteobacteria bacterium]MBK8918719.1 flagellar biosynthesis protein FlhF [Betaproteobacteria bacterium]MBP6034652.1 flagellar biosynthesis protein FlhF [Azonexus sp.]MBP6905192.1 flagellar biosynthesis protein FlhF [Azonexus sp.]